MRLVTGVAPPKRTILGTVFAGEVEAIGAQATSFAPGDRVFGPTPGGYGGHAEYLCLSQDEAFTLMPAGMDFTRRWSARAPASRTLISITCLPSGRTRKADNVTG
jgi:NADPH:quinone reductase-like Zn-dependent oxidoreductase